jgi:hypothetical protein
MFRGNIPESAAGYDPHRRWCDRFHLCHISFKLTRSRSEKLQAIASPWAEMVHSMQDRHVSDEGGLAHVLEWDTKRGRDFQCLANFIFCCDGLPKQTIPTHQKMEKFLVRPDAPSPAFKQAIGEVLTEFYYIATEHKLRDGFTKIGKRLAPVEFVYIGSFFATFPSQA